MESVVKMGYNVTKRVFLAALERNLVPDMVIRRLRRSLLARSLRNRYKPSLESQLSELLQFVHSSQDMPIATDTDKPNIQHFELPTSFFKLVLGKSMKYSCCYFRENSSTLEDAENAMLELYCERAQVKDGHNIVDVGCGWGSLSLYLAQKYPNCKITGILNSKTQKAYMEEKCREMQLQNVKTIHADISTFEMEGSFDRVFSIEMFEYMKNYKKLLKKISNWMTVDGLLFVQCWCHKMFVDHFEDSNEDDWIINNFLTEVIAPSTNFLLYFQEDVSILNHWLVNGKHFVRTSQWSNSNGVLHKPSASKGKRSERFEEDSEGSNLEIRVFDLLEMQLFEPSSM